MAAGWYDIIRKVIGWASAIPPRGDAAAIAFSNERLIASLRWSSDRVCRMEVTTERLR